MSDFLGSAKNFVNSAVSRTSWEAQKQMRVRSKQTEIDKLVDQRHQLMDELGQVAMNLYQSGALTDTQLSRLCAAIFELDHDLKGREKQILDVKAEGYPADQFAPSPTTNYAPPTPSSPPPTGSGANTQAGAGTQTGTQVQPCPQCGKPLRPNALYCRNCGAKMR